MFIAILYRDGIKINREVPKKKDNSENPNYLLRQKIGSNRGILGYCLEINYTVLQHQSAANCTRTVWLGTVILLLILNFSPARTES